MREIGSIQTEASGEWQNLTAALAEFQFDLGWELDFLVVQTHLRPVPDMAPALVLTAPLAPLSLDTVWPPPRRLRPAAGNRARVGEQRRASGRGRNHGRGNSSGRRGDGPFESLGAVADGTADSDVDVGALADAYDIPDVDAAESEEDERLEEAPLEGGDADDHTGGGVGELRFADARGVEGDTHLQEDATDEEMSGDGEPGLHPDNISDGLPEPASDDADQPSAIVAEPVVMPRAAVGPPREAGARSASSAASSAGEVGPPSLPPRPDRDILYVLENGSRIVFVCEVPELRGDLWQHDSTWAM